MTLLVRGCRSTRGKPRGRKSSAPFLEGFARLEPPEFHAGLQFRGRGTVQLDVRDGMVGVHPDMHRRAVLAAAKLDLARAQFEFLPEAARRGRKGSA